MADSTRTHGVGADGPGIPRASLDHNGKSRVHSATSAVQHSSVTESDDYTKSVSGIDIEVVRTGVGVSPTEIRSVSSLRWAGSSLRIGFPVFSRTALSSDVIGVGVIEEAPQGMRWSGIDVVSGDVLVYGPAAEHVAVQPEGARFSYAVFSAETLSRIADRFDSEISVTTGSVQRARRSPTSRNVGTLLPSVVRGEPRSRAPVEGKSDLAETVAYMLAGGVTGDPSPSRKLDDRLIVQTCINYAERAARIPTITELRGVTHVSERRLHQAFTDTHGLPPYRFFLTWALDIARRRLLTSDSNQVTVAWVAFGAGFSHLGRFAQYYRQTYGESPSDTLRRDRGAVEL